MARYFVPPAAQQAARSERHVGRRSIDTRDPFANFDSNWSGYPIPAGSTTKVIETQAFYLDGGPYADGRPQTAEEASRNRELGMPIDGDEMARFHFWKRTGTWPRLREVWASIGIGPDGEIIRSIQDSLFDI